jgi:phage terminase large subunit
LSRWSVANRWVDYYENSGFGLEHYVQEIRKRREQHGFVFGDHYFPHDVNNGEISSGKSRFDTLVGLGHSACRGAADAERQRRHQCGAAHARAIADRSDPVRARRENLEELSQGMGRGPRDVPRQAVARLASHGADSLRNSAQGYVDPAIVRPRGRYQSKQGGGGSWESE